MSDFALARWIFLRGLGLVYLVAFWSLWRQAAGLFGPKGLLPAGEMLAEAAHDTPRWRRLLAVPTVFWAGHSARALHVACAAGVLASAAIVTDVAVVPALVVTWALYLSFLMIGRDFLSFQWDVLLVETGFLAIVFAAVPAVSLVMLGLLWWLAFRLMFESGAVKLSCGDRTWRKLTALDYHYFTQPLPTPAAWYLHHAPAWTRKASVAITYVIEIGLPFLIFVSAEGRLVAFAGFAALMLLIAFSGNYGFFNYLTIVLAIPLVDDGVWARILPPGLVAAAPPTRWEWEVVPAILAGLTLVISVPQLVRAVKPRFFGPRWIRRLERALQPFFLVNAYGLFRNMTTERPEIVVEGSDNRREWKAYEFRYKVGDVRRAPPVSQPHQPRLDWQMWFAALGDLQSNVWLQALLARLLEGSPEVLRLLRKDPFGGKPPRYIRARLYRYELTSAEEKKRSGAWWRRTLLGEYSPTFTRRDEE